MRKTIIIGLLFLTGVLLSSCETTKQYERGDLARPIMRVDRNALIESMNEHLYFSREAAFGGNGVGGGGCGCN